MKKITEYYFHEAFVGGYSSCMIGDGLNAAFYGVDFDLVVSSLKALDSAILTTISVGIANKAFSLQGISYGRGSWSAVSSQIYTKFKRGQITSISAKTFGKMFGVSLYESLADLFIVGWGGV